jgi:hypothetical protein
MDKVENGWVVTGTFTDGERVGKWSWGYNEENPANAFTAFFQQYVGMMEEQKQK